MKLIDIFRSTKTIQDQKKDLAQALDLIIKLGEEDLTEEEHDWLELYFSQYNFGGENNG